MLIVEYFLMFCCYSLVIYIVSMWSLFLLPLIFFVLFFSHNDFCSLFFQVDIRFHHRCFFPVAIDVVDLVFCVGIFVVVWSRCRCRLERGSWLIVVFGVFGSDVADDLLESTAVFCCW